MFMLAIAQVGPLLVLVPAVVWLYWKVGTAWGTFLLVWTVVVATMDNFLRPVLIKKGANLPLLLIFAGGGRRPHRIRAHRHFSSGRWCLRSPTRC